MLPHSPCTPKCLWSGCALAWPCLSVATTCYYHVLRPGLWSRIGKGYALMRITLSMALDGDDCGRE